jgi:hypothetical protein
MLYVIVLVAIDILYLRVYIIYGVGGQLESLETMSVSVLGGLKRTNCMKMIDLFLFVCVCVALLEQTWSSM